MIGDNTPIIELLINIHAKITPTRICLSILRDNRRQDSNGYLPHRIKFI
jgi:hypothetical protein